MVLGPHISHPSSQQPYKVSLVDWTFPSCRPWAKASSASDLLRSASRRNQEGSKGKQDREGQEAKQGWDFRWTPHPSPCLILSSGALRHDLHLESVLSWSSSSPPPAPGSHWLQVGLGHKLQKLLILEWGKWLQRPRIKELPRNHSTVSSNYHQRWWYCVAGPGRYSEMPSEWQDMNFHGTRL